MADLQTLADVEAGDPFTFVVGPARPMTGGVAGARVVVRALLGATEFGSFPVDLSTELAMVAAVERRQVQPVVEVDRIGPLPAFVLYPLADQVADKVCALYERYGPQRLPSTRYRDLVDLVLITGHFDLDAAELTAALAQEAGRRGLQLPAAMEGPGAAWAQQYPRTARDTMVPTGLQSLSEALAAVGACLDPVLAHARTSGRWHAATASWTDVPLPPTDQP